MWLPLDDLNDCKKRLFACECAERAFVMSHFPPREESIAVVKKSRQYARGEIDYTTLKSFQKEAEKVATAWKRNGATDEELKQANLPKPDPRFFNPHPMGNLPEGVHIDSIVFLPQIILLPEEKFSCIVAEIAAHTAEKQADSAARLTTHLLRSSREDEVYASELAWQLERIEYYKSLNV